MAAGPGIAPEPSPLQGVVQTVYTTRRMKSGPSAGYRAPVCRLSAGGSAFELQREMK